MRQVTEADIIAIASAIAGSAGNYIDYSTTEKIVGTWIDGKPIYQKTYTNVSIGVTADWTKFDDTIPYDTLVDVKCVLQLGTGQNMVIANNLEDSPRFMVSNGNMLYFASASRTIAAITLQYTKTSS